MRFSGPSAACRIRRVPLGSPLRPFLFLIAVAGACFTGATLGILRQQVPAGVVCGIAGTAFAALACYVVSLYRIADREPEKLIAVWRRACSIARNPSGIGLPTIDVLDPLPPPLWSERHPRRGRVVLSEECGPIDFQSVIDQVGGEEYECCEVPPRGSGQFVISKVASRATYRCDTASGIWDLPQARLVVSCHPTGTSAELCVARPAGGAIKLTVLVCVAAFGLISAAYAGGPQGALGVVVYSAMICVVFGVAAIAFVLRRRRIRAESDGLLQVWAKTRELSPTPTHPSPPPERLPQRRA